jgi:hypothetical protein
MPGLADGCCKEGSLKGYVFCTKKKKTFEQFNLFFCLELGRKKKKLNQAEDRKGTMQTQRTRLLEVRQEKV